MSNVHLGVNPEPHRRTQQCKKKMWRAFDGTSRAARSWKISLTLIWIRSSRCCRCVNMEKSWKVFCYEKSFYAFSLWFCSLVQIFKFFTLHIATFFFFCKTSFCARSREVEKLQWSRYVDSFAVVITIVESALWRLKMFYCFFFQLQLIQVISSENIFNPHIFHKIYS